MKKVIIGGEAGVALVLALLTIALLTGLGAALVLVTASETTIAGNFRVGTEAFYAADAAFERAFADLHGLSDWTPVLQGSLRSSFTDGTPTGVRTLSDGSTINLAQITNTANCQQVAACSDAEMNAKTTDRPWGSNNPRWKAYVYGPLADLMGPASVRSAFYVVAFVGDDPSEMDDDPGRDGGSPSGLANPGRGRVLVRAEAFGPRGTHRVIEATIARIDTSPAGLGTLLVLSWREVR